MIGLLDFILLGSGGSMPSLGRHLSSAIINYQGRKVLIDCGEGNQIAMRKVHSGFKTVDIICITHFHGDHIFGLPGLLSTMGKSGRIKPVTIIGPTGLKKIIEGFLMTMSKTPYDIKLIEDPKVRLKLGIANGILQVNAKDNCPDTNMILSTIELEHSVPCLGYDFYILRKPKFNVEKAVKLGIPKEKWSRLQNGEEIYYNNVIYTPDMILGKARKGIKISYIVDTRPMEIIPDFIAESDLFICEGTYGDEGDLKKAIDNKHMIFKEAAQLAVAGRVKQLLITHFSPSIADPDIYKQNAISIFKNTVIGYDGYRKTLSFE